MKELGIVEFARHTLGLKLYPLQSLILRETWAADTTHSVMCLGRRSGKTLIASICALYAALVKGDIYRSMLGVKKTFVIYMIANSRVQSKIALDTVRELIQNSPKRILKNGKIWHPSMLVVDDNKFTISLKNGAEFMALPTSSRTVRGQASPIIIFDELAHSLDTKGDSSADNIYQALRPGVAQFGIHSRTIMLSSPWNDEGLFYEYYSKGAKYNLEDNRFEYENAALNGVKVFQFPTWKVNPSISLSYLLGEKRRDPDLYQIEYGANFSKSVNYFMASSVLENAIDTSLCGDHNEAYKKKYRYTYSLGLDPAKGGVGRDSYVACLTHYEEDPDDRLRSILVVDFWYQFEANFNGIVSTNEVVSWIKEINRIYGIAVCSIDQYNSMGIIEQLTGEVDIKEFVWSEKTITLAFSKLRDLFYDNRIRIPDCGKAKSQLRRLKRVLKKGGMIEISGGEGVDVDDYCFALAISAYNAPLPGSIYV